MTVYERNCCYLLYKYLKRDLDFEEISDKTVNLGLNVYLKYRQINDKIKNNLSLTSDESSFLNHIFYDNEMLLILLSLEIRKLINRLKNNPNFNEDNIDYYNLVLNRDNSKTKIYKL